MSHSELMSEWSDVSKMCQEFFREEDPVKLLNSIISRSLSLLRAERATVFLTSDFLNQPERSFSEHGFVKCQDQLNSIVAVGLDGDQISVDIQNSLAGSCYLSQQAFVCEDAQNDPRFNSSIDQKTGFQTHSTLCVPLGGGVGVLQVLNAQAGKFTDADLEKAKIVAFFSSVALEHLKKVREVGALKKGLADYQNAQVKTSTNNLVSECPSLQEVYFKLPHIAKSEANVLITGEAGVGKEYLALQIHRLSRRKQKACIKVNCSLLSRNNIEEELLGSKDEWGQRVFGGKGKLDLADGGTLVLDRVNEMSPTVQVLLLKILRDHKSGGADGAIPSGRRRDFRVLSIASPDIKESVGDKKFREDLYYFLNVVGIPLPNLLSRGEDIPRLMEEILNELKEENTSLQEKTFAPDCAEFLKSQNWPGNIRQLRNLIESATLVSGGRKEISIPDFSGNLNSAISGSTGKVLPFPAGGRDGVNAESLFQNPNFKEAKRDFEVEFVNRALERNGGNKSKTAASIGLSREALRKVLLPRGEKIKLKKAS